jgi:hypothetical protein
MGGLARALGATVAVAGLCAPPAGAAGNREHRPSRRVARLR